MVSRTHVGFMAGERQAGRASGGQRRGVRACRLDGVGQFTGHHVWQRRRAEQGKAVGEVVLGVGGQLGEGRGVRMARRSLGAERDDRPEFGLGRGVMQPGCCRS